MKANHPVLYLAQFFAPYGKELKAFADKLGKPVGRFYISHDHPDHYLGFGDAVPDAEVYALASTKASIEKEGQTVLDQRRAKFGPMIAGKLNPPRHTQAPGEEVIEGVKFIFEESDGNEAAASLVIKLPSLGVCIAQDIAYAKVHLFISGDTKGWANALKKIRDEKGYDTVLAGHGKEGGRALLNEDLKYLAFVDKALARTKTKAEYKAKLLAAYPGYAGTELIDIYLGGYLKNPNWKE